MIVSLRCTVQRSPVWKLGSKDAKFLFLHSAADDPARAGYLQKLIVLNEELETALQELNECQIAIVKSLERKRNRKDDDNKVNNKGKGGTIFSHSILN